MSACTCPTPALRVANSYKCTCCSGIKKAVRALKANGGDHPLKGRVFLVTSDGKDGHGVELREGDQYRVLEGDGDAILIEILGGRDNPHMGSSEFLRSVSDSWHESTG